MFSWDDPPATGHPGKDYNCRCEAVPYVPGETEYAGHEIIGSLASSYGKWAIVDFLRHFYTGGGASVTLSQIGHLSDIVEQYAYYDEDAGAHRRLPQQIIEGAWKKGEGVLVHDFNDSYDFEYANMPGSIPHGDAVVRGLFVGNVTDLGDYLSIEGEINFYFSDIFTDPPQLRDYLAWIRQQPRKFRELLSALCARIGITDDVYRAEDIDPNDVAEWFFRLTEFGGTAYPIRDSWRSEFKAEIRKDRTKSRYDAK